MRSNEEALDLFADLIEPAAEILSDPKVQNAIQSGGKPATAVKWAIKNHKQAVIEILARVDGIPVDEYSVNVFTLPKKLVELMNLPEVQELFTGQALNVNASSGSATVNTEDGVN